MPVTKVKVNGEWIPAMPVGGGGEGDMTKAVYDTNDDGVVNAADQATKDGSGNVITSTYAAKATTLSGYGIIDAKIENGSIILGSNSITPLTSFTETDPVFSASAAHGISNSDISNWNDKLDSTYAYTSGDSINNQASISGYAGQYGASIGITAYNTSNATDLSLTVADNRIEMYDVQSEISFIKVEPYSSNPNNGTVSIHQLKSPSYNLDAANKLYVDTAVSGKADSATTLAGYGITDANIQNGTITLGSNSITPLTSYTEIDPIFTASVAHGITSSDITNWNNKSGYIIGYCDTPAADAVKEIQIFDPQFEGQSTSGETLLIRFKYGNNNTSSSLAFKIGDTTRLASVCSFYDYSTGSSTTSKTFTKGIHALAMTADSWNFYKGCDVHTAFSSAHATKAIQDNSGNTITSTYATKAEIPTIPTNVSAFTNDAGYITSYTETDPVFSASAAAGITSTDITNWNNKVSDDHNWGGVSLGSGRMDSTSDQWIPCKGDTTNNSGTAYWIKTTQELPTSSSVEFIQIPRYKKIDNQWYLQSTTPTSTDNSIKVATTAFVQTVLGGYIASDTTANFTISDTAPSNPQTGDLWLDTASQSASGIAYLPLSAGVDHPLTGDLHAIGTTIRMERSDRTTDLRIYESSSGGYVTQIGAGGIYMDDTGYVTIYGNNNSLYLRPNGAFNTAGQVYIDNAGTLTTAGNILMTNSNPLIQNTDGKAGFRMYEGGEAVVWATNTNIYLRPQGYNSTVSQFGFLNGGLIRVDASASSYAGLTRRNSGASSDNAYIHFTSGGYCDIWSTQVTQIRCGTGNEESTTVNFMFNTNGVLKAPGMYTTTRSGSTLVIDSSGYIGRTSSLKKYKKNILPITDEDAIKGFNLNPITYTSALEYDLQNTQYGLIAEEVEEVLPNLCTYDTEGNIDGVAYDRVCTILLKQNQMLKVRVDALEEKVAKLETK